MDSPFKLSRTVGRSGSLTIDLSACLSRNATQKSNGCWSRSLARPYDFTTDTRDSRHPDPAGSRVIMSSS